MSHTKHTPGPWNTGARYGDLKTEILSDGYRAVATVWTHAYDPANDKLRSTKAHPEGQANARLIAAAPELLEACKQIVWKLSHNHSGPDYEGPGRIDRRDATVKMAIAAIAKATEKASN